MKRRELADVLNKRGLHTGHDLPWNTSRLRGPLERAEEMLAEEDEDIMSKLPVFRHAKLTPMAGRSASNFDPPQV